jgi:rare lipoprotein A
MARVTRTIFWAVLVALLVGALWGCGAGRYVPSFGGGTAPAPPQGQRGTGKPYTVMGQTYYPLQSADGFEEVGVASWYGPDFHGKRTSNGEMYDMYQMTAAHRILPMNTRLLVTNLENGRSAEVRVNDRGPFVGNRVLDLSYAAAQRLGVVGPGTARVHLRALGGPVYFQGPFYVQYGAFTVRDNAERLRERLLARGYPGTRITEGWVGGVRFWRVQVGTFPSLSQAQAARERFLPESPDCFVIAD